MVWLPKTYRVSVINIQEIITPITTFDYLAGNQIQPGYESAEA